MSTADILAAARAKTGRSRRIAGRREHRLPKQRRRGRAEARPTKAAQASRGPKAAPAALPPGQRPTVPQILAWCRQHDAK